MVSSVQDEAEARPRPPIGTSFFYGWLLVAVSGVVTFAEVAYFQPVLAVFVLPLQEEFGWSRATVAGAMGFGSIAGGFTSPLVGPILDRWGGRWVIAITGVIMSVCFFALAGAQSVIYFYIFFVIGRAATVGAMSLATSVTISNWFIRNRGLAISYMHLGTRIGQGIVPAIAAILISIYDWRLAFIGMGAMILVLAVIPSLALMRRRPEDVGLDPDGIPVSERDASRPDEVETQWKARDAIRTTAFWLLIAATSASFMAGAAVQLHLIPYMQDLGFSVAIAISVQSLLSIIGAPGGVLGGFIQRRLGTRYTFVLALLGHAAGMYILVIADTLLVAYIFATVYGIFHGMSLIMHSMIFATYFGRQSLGTIRGLASPIQLGMNALGPVLGGLAFDITGSYFIAFAGFGILYLVSAALMFFVRRPIPRTNAGSTPAVA
jgi:MFS transporter, OFA family, oxalate/formate antiporter